MSASSLIDVSTLAILRAGVLILLIFQNAYAFEEQLVRRLPPIAATATSSPISLASYYENQPHTPFAGASTFPDFEIGAEFDRGVFIRSTDLDARPYAIYIGGRLQLRHSGFTRDATDWTDSAGVTREIRNRNQFDAERVRLNISGTAVDPRLTYIFVFDGDADRGSDVQQLAYIFSYEFHPAFQMLLGRWKAASDREWLLSSRHLRFVDRAMATGYFRAGYSDGVWLLGDLGEAFHYEASLTNGLNTSTTEANNLDDNLSFALTAYCDPLGPYGDGEADYACHTEPVIRLGWSFAFDKSDDRSDVGLPLGDEGLLRLSDGTLLADVGALAPGVRVLSARVLKASFDAGLKWRGWSLSGEYFIRSIQDLRADGLLPVNKLDDYGFRFDAGVFLVPKRFDVNLRMSQVSGLQGDALEYSIGCNWYWGDGRIEGKLDDRINKLSFDVTELKGTPTTIGASDFLAGDDGVLFRTQVQVGF